MSVSDIAGVPAMLRVGLIAAVPARAWQHQLAEALLALPGVLVMQAGRTPATATSWLWRRICSRAPTLQCLARGTIDKLPVIEPTQCDILIDLAGAATESLPEGFRWRLVDADGRPLGMSFAGLSSMVSAATIVVRLEFRRDQQWWVLCEAQVSASYRYMSGLDRQYELASRLLCQQIQLRILNRDDALPAQNAAISEPGPWQTGGKLMAACLRALLTRFHKLVYAESWMIGVIDTPLANCLSGQDLPPIRWLGHRNSSRYLADPFVMPGRNDRLYCELFDERRANGRIVELCWRGMDIVAEREVSFGIDTHLSFPFLLRDGDELYCLPEASATRRCVLYKQQRNGEWAVFATLLEDVAAADACLFFWQQRWWLAYTDVDLGAFDNLCLAYADTLAGPWQRHLQHPVKWDHRSARSAGNPFWHEGELYRPAQDCSVRYGGAITFNRIKQCSPSGFVEEPVRLWLPERKGRNPHGLHTISSWGEVVLVDGKRELINPVVLYRKLRRRLGLARPSTPAVGTAA